MKHQTSRKLVLSKSNIKRRYNVNRNKMVIRLRFTCDESLKKYEHDCLRKLLLLLMSLLAALIIKKTVIFWLEFTLSFKKNILRLNLKDFPRIQRKDRESIYKRRQILALLLQISCSNFGFKLDQKT